MNPHRSIGEVICRNVTLTSVNAGALYDGILELLEEMRREIQNAQAIVDLRMERERCAQELEKAGHQEAANVVRGILDQEG